MRESTRAGSLLMLIFGIAVIALLAVSVYASIAGLDQVDDLEDRIASLEQHQPETPSTAMKAAEAAGEQSAAVPTVQTYSFFCLITHEQPGDEEFWNLVRWARTRIMEDLGVRVEYKAGPTVAEQAQHIRDCVSDGAAGIATTLADPDGLATAIEEAVAAGVAVVSFNSGLSDFRALGIPRHHSIDEAEAGRLAGVRLNEHGTTQPVLCLIHERSNVGLDERCDGLEQGYAGDVERLTVTGTRDIKVTRQEIAEHLGGRAFGAVVALNTQIGLAAVNAISVTGSSAVVATFDQSSAVLEAITRGEILFAIDTAPFNQAFYALSILIPIAGSSERARVWRERGIDYNVILGQVAATLSPRVFTKENAAQWLEVNRIIRSE